MGCSLDSVYQTLVPLVKSKVIAYYFRGRLTSNYQSGVVAEAHTIVQQINKQLHAAFEPPTCKTTLHNPNTLLYWFHLLRQ